MDVSDKLLGAVKNYLNITWDDEATDAKISGLIAAGREYLDNKIGDIGDYEAAGMRQMLLFDFVRYARDSALDVFENNYLALLLGQQSQKAVNEFAANSEQTE